MASSNAETLLGCEYQVFLSFRGPDTRISFTNNLYHCLTDAGIFVFQDNEELCVGERIDGSLQRAINNSKIYIPIFSRSYASSQWCLRKLAQIMANSSKPEANKEILPIFLDVKPDDVKLKTRLYRNAIQKLKCEKKLSNEQVDVWIEALKEVDAIKGWEARKYGGHGELIKLVVEVVVKKLKTKHRLEPEHLIGIDDRVVAIKKRLDIDSGDVRFLRIYGMGGIGKTTLARVVFNQLLSHFGKYCCFLQDVNARSSRTNEGLLELQKRLLSEIDVHGGTRSIDEIDYGMQRIGEVLSNKKVFIVLDNVRDSEQVEYLIGNGTLYSGSRILITTRNKDDWPKYQFLDYEMEVMIDVHARELFHRHAFPRGSPSNNCKKLSRAIVSATGRLPLALKVIGSFLARHNTKEVWEETLKKLKKAPHEDVFQMLKISYDDLTDVQQQIFLDIACFFVGENKTSAIYVWEDCDIFPHTALSVLISRSLVKIVEKNKFWMHDQLRDLGREIVIQENRTNPGERSRMWICEETLDAMETDEMKENVGALDLDLRENHPKVVIKSKEIEKFKHLKYLKLNGGTFIGNLGNHLTQLRWIFWSHHSPTSNSTNMHLKNVVVLQFSDNDFIDDQKLQSFIKMATKLKVLSLKSCKKINGTLDFSRCTNLERLTFEDCSNMDKIDVSIAKLKRLIDLKIFACHCLQNLPEAIGDLEKLEHFIVQKCHKVMKLPESVWKLKSLRELHFSTDGAFDSKNSWKLPSAIEKLQKLEILQVNSPYLKGQLPSEVGRLPRLETLDLSRTEVNEVPETISSLPCLQRLELTACHHIQKLPALPTSLTYLKLESTLLQVVPDLSNLTNLVELYLDDGGERGKRCTGGFFWIKNLSKLTKLSLRLDNVPSAIHLQKFPELPSSLQKLGLNDVRLIESLCPNMRNLSSLELFGAKIHEFQFDELQLPNLGELLVQNCSNLNRFSLSSMRKLKDVRVDDCSSLKRIEFPRVFESLEALSIVDCKSLSWLVYVGVGRNDNNDSPNEFINHGEKIILPSRSLNKLQSFVLSYCQQIDMIQIVGVLESLEQFTVRGCHSLESLRGLPNSKNLKSLSVNSCNTLKDVEGIDELEFLEDLQVDGCGLLERFIDVSSTKLQDDCRITISGCGKNFRKNFKGSLEDYKHHKEQESDCESDFEQEQEFNPGRRLRHFLFDFLKITLLLCFFFYWNEEVGDDLIADFSC